MSKTLHIPKHFVGPPENKSVLDPKSKLLLTTVRDAVFALLDGKDAVTVKRYAKKINWNSPPKKLGEKESIEVKFTNQEDVPLRAQVKNNIHEVLDTVGINKNNTSKRLRTAVEKLGKQYKYMSPERFEHRLQILEGESMSKIERDTRYLLGNMKLFMSFGTMAMSHTLDMLFSDGYFAGLHKSASLAAIKKIIEKAKEMKRTLPNGKARYKEFKDTLYRVANSF